MVYLSSGCPYKAVEHSISALIFFRGNTIYDPFMGSGTANLTAKTLGINSIGVEAHPFVYPIAKAKLNWDIQSKSIKTFIELVQQKLVKKSNSLQTKKLGNEFLN